MRIVLIGSSGQLAKDLLPLLGEHDVVALSHADLELRDHAAVQARLERERPAVVINTAAFHRVDHCEVAVEDAFAVNALAVLNLARWCERHGAALVHFSTDYVFAGDSGSACGEADLPRPLSVYAASKLAGEYLARQACSRHFIIRTCGLYGRAGRTTMGGNFVETMLRLAREGRPIRVVDDQVVGPTATADLAPKVIEVLRRADYGLYHITNSGACSWFEFAAAIFELAGVAADLKPVSSQEFAAPARRPAYSVLRHDHLAALGLDDMPGWREGLARYLRPDG